MTNAVELLRIARPYVEMVANGEGTAAEMVRAEAALEAIDEALTTPSPAGGDAELIARLRAIDIRERPYQSVTVTLTPDQLNDISLCAARLEALTRSAGS